MSLEVVLRACALVAAMAVLAAPYYESLAAGALRLLEAARQHVGLLSRLGAAALIVAAAWGKVPMPQFQIELPLPSVAVTEPGPEMAALVQPVRQALAGISAADRVTWVAIWNRAAGIVEAESADSDPVFKDIPSLRALTMVALDLGWRRLSSKPPGGLPGLREGVERALATAVGKDATSLTDEMRDSYAEVCRALAWAGAR